jgi:hypothetical protein
VFLDVEAHRLKTLDIYMALELDRRIAVFFDKAAFCTTKG